MLLTAAFIMAELSALKDESKMNEEQKSVDEPNGDDSKLEQEVAQESEGSIPSPTDAEIESEIEAGVEDQMEQESEQMKDKSEENEGRSKIRFEESLSKAEILAYLEGIVDGLRRGSLKFVQDGEELELGPNDFMKFRVKASRKKEEEKVAFELEWKKKGERSFEVVGS